MATLDLVEAGRDRLAHLPLLLLADDIAASYLQEGDLWVYDGGVGAVLSVPSDDEPDTVELRNVAVAEDRQGRGVGRAMIAAVLGALARQGHRRAVVGTGTADPRTYVVYQVCGFRPWRIERDVFTEERGYDPAELVEANGLVHRDMLWFDTDLVRP
jgi:GNAT superfamily N-acetyltransferase